MGEFGKGTLCVCKEGNHHDAGLTCGHCTRDKDLISGVMVADKRDGVLTTKMTPKEIQRRLYLLHSATGHGQVKHLVQTLRRRGVAETIIKAAENFKCPICEERKRPQPRNVSSLEPLPQRFATVSADIGHWIHPYTQEKWQFVVMVDEGFSVQSWENGCSGEETTCFYGSIPPNFQGVMGAVLWFTPKL